MGNFFKEKINSIIPMNKKNSTQSKDIKEKELINFKYGDIIEIEIFEECTLDEFHNNLNKYKGFNNLTIPLGVFITDSIWRSSSAKIKKQKIYIIESDDSKYFINKNEDKVHILQYQQYKKHEIDYLLKINIKNKKWSITSGFLDFRYSPEIFKSLGFSRIDAMLSKLKSIDSIQNILNIRYLYETLNLVMDHEYYPIISDKILTLSIKNGQIFNQINRTDHQDFDIILNDTKEKVGIISLDYKYNGFSLGGNVSYSIKDEYKNKNYATNALKLLKEILKSNNFNEYKENLMIYNNVDFLNIIEPNNGELDTENEVFNDTSLYMMDEIKKARIYRMLLK